MGGARSALYSRGRRCRRRKREGDLTIARIDGPALPQGLRQRHRLLVEGLQVRLRAVGLGLGLRK